MAALGNPQHERFCQEYHRLVYAGGKPKESAIGAYRAAGYETGEEYVAQNSRKLRQRKDIRSRLAELSAFAAKLAGIDAAWALVELKSLHDEVKNFNLDDYLGPPDAEGNRYYDLSKVPREKLGLLIEYSMETASEKAGEDGETREIRKVRIKGPSKAPERVAILALMARIQGWEAPRKNEHAGPGGGPINVVQQLLSEIDGTTRGLPADLAETQGKSK